MCSISECDENDVMDSNLTDYASRNATDHFVSIRSQIAKIDGLNLIVPMKCPESMKDLSDSKIRSKSAGLTKLIVDLLLPSKFGNKNYQDYDELRPHSDKHPIK